jgi:hypothetical protein
MIRSFAAMLAASLGLLAAALGLLVASACAGEPSAGEPNGAKSNGAKSNGAKSNAATSNAGNPLAPLSVRYAADSATAAGDETPNFQRHIVPLFGRLGCNGRSCHGSFQGRGGFRLSMFGYDFDLDHKAVLAGDPPRANLKQLKESLILTKPTSDDEHGGGKRFERGG